MIFSKSDAKPERKSCYSTEQLKRKLNCRQRIHCRKDTPVVPLFFHSSLISSSHPSFDCILVFVYSFLVCDTYNDIMNDPHEYEQDDQEDHSHDDDEDDEDEDENDVGRHFRPSTTTLSSPGIGAPALKDVICGRGKMTSSHPGNRKLRDLVIQRKLEYQRAKRRDEKTSITSEIVQTLRELGRYGRFAV